jgi:spermidine/putrescine transport system ATP-binding protein
MIRPERVRIEPHGTPGDNRLPGLVEHLVFLGSFREVRVRLLGGALVTAIQPNDGSEPPYEQGSPVSVHLPVESLRVLPEGSAPVAGERAAGEGTEIGDELGRATATALLPPQDPPPAS